MAEISSQADLSEVDRLARRASIGALAEAMLGRPDIQIPVEDLTSHHFAGGVYCRELRLPAGTTAVGQIHKTENLAILLQGIVQIATENGVETFEAPRIIVSPPGIQRAAHAVTDAIWLSIHAVNAERDLAIIEKQFVAPSYEALEAEAVPEQLVEAA